MNAPSKVTVLPEVLVRRVELLGQLDVRPFAGHLVVDGSALATNGDGQRQQWVLVDASDGTWRHDESNLRGRLGQVLYAIAASFEPGDLMDPACRVCGCTDHEACAGGCAWVHDPAGLGDLCSACLDGVLAELARPKLTPARRAAIEVLAHGHEAERPVRSSDHTTDLDAERPPAAPLDLCIHTKIADWLDAHGLAERTDRYAFYYRLTPAGHHLATTVGERR